VRDVRHLQLEEVLGCSPHSKRCASTRLQPRARARVDSALDTGGYDCAGLEEPAAQVAAQAHGHGCAGLQEQRPNLYPQTEPMSTKAVAHWSEKASGARGRPPDSPRAVTVRPPTRGRLPWRSQSKYWQLGRSPPRLSARGHPRRRAVGASERWDPQPHLPPRLSPCASVLAVVPRPGRCHGLPGEPTPGPGG